MQKNLETQILELIRKMKEDERQIKGKNEIDSVKDIRYIENAIKIDGKPTNIICMVLDKGKDETSYRYYINNELICIVDSDIAKEPIFTNSRVKEQEVIKEKLRLLIQNPEKYGKEEVSVGQEIDKNEKLILKIAAELGLSKEELKRIGILNAKEKIHRDDKDEQNKNEEKEGKKIYEDDLNLKQNINTETKVDEMKTLGQFLKLPSECEKIAVIESYEMSKIDKDNDLTTRYSFVAINKDGTVQKLEGLKQDMSVGNNSTQNTYKVMHDGDIEKNMILSRFTINGTNATLSIKNGNMGQVEVYLSPDKTRDGNESMDKQIATDNIWPSVRTEIRDIAGHYSSDGYRAVDEAVDRAEDTYTEDKDDTEYKDIDEHEETVSDNTKQLEEIGLDDKFEYEGETTTIREYAERNGYEDLNEILTMFKESQGSAEERLNDVDEQINEQYRGNERKR